MGRKELVSAYDVIIAIMNNGDFKSYIPENLVKGASKSWVRKVSQNASCVSKGFARRGYTLTHAPNYDEWMSDNYGSNEDPPQYPPGAVCENCCYLNDCPMLEKKRKDAKNRSKLIVR